MPYIEKRFVSPFKVCALILAVACFIVVAGSTTAEGPGVEVGPNNTSRGLAGSVVTYNHVLTNTGDISDTMAVRATSQYSWPVMLSSGDQQSATSLITLNLGISQTVTIQLSVTIPISAAGITDITTIAVTSQLSPTMYVTATDATTVWMSLYLPVNFLHWPPVPYRPTLYSIYNPVNDGTYYVNWSAVKLADIYILEEDDNPTFQSPMEVYRGYDIYWQTPSSRLLGTYYYRVYGSNAWGQGEISNIVSVVVLSPQTPTLTQIDNSDQDNGYNLNWDNTARTTSYIVQEDTTPSFSSAIVIGTFGSNVLSWSVTGKTPNTYYYRIAAIGPTGTSNWSNPQSVVIHPFFVGLSLRWDGSGYIRGSEYKDVGWHYTASFLNLTDADTIQAQWTFWYDPNPDSWSQTQEYDYYSVSTGAWKSSTTVSDPSWKWGDPFRLLYDRVLVSGQVTYINGQAFNVTGPFQGYTAFGKSVRYWQLVNRDKFLMWDGGGSWTQYVHPGDAVLQYDAENTKLELYSSIKRHSYYNGSLTTDTVQYITQLTSANSYPAALNNKPQDISHEDTTLPHYGDIATQINAFHTPLPQDGMKGYGKLLR